MKRMNASDSNVSVVDLLLTLDPPDRGPWEQYELLGISREHVPELIRIATDTELLWAEMESPESWAPVHAWRALGQFRSEAAVAPLAQLLKAVEDDDWIMEELPRVFELIGRPAVGELTKYIRSGTGIFDRAVAAEALKRIADREPEYRSECIAILSEVLSRFEENPPVLNSLLIGDLIDLNGVEAAGIIKSAFDADRVDIRHQGDWEDVQIELGLLSERLTPGPFPAWHGSPLDRAISPVDHPARTRSETPHAKRKKKRKSARQSRKRNRKKH
jgi:hypothetical protein